MANYASFLAPLSAEMRDSGRRVRPRNRCRYVLTCGKREVGRNDVSRRELFRRFIACSASLMPSPAQAEATNPYFDQYDQFSSTYDALDGNSFLAKALGFNALRSELLSQAWGRVLEVGVGTGINLPLYDYNKVESITGLDLSENMMALAKQRARNSLNGSARVQFVRGRVESIPFPAEAFDTVVDTFSLCVFPDPMASLREMTRVLKKSPASTMLLLEHTISRNPVLAEYQEFTAEPTAAMSKGCYPNQNVLKMVHDAGCIVRRCQYHLADTIVLLELGITP